MKVLIISHNPLSTQSNMGKTILSLFSGFEQEELCQLYIYPSFPDRDGCASYYRMTDKEALVSVFSRKQPGGEVEKHRIGPEQGLYENPEDQTFYKDRKNKSALRRLLRDAMWSLSPWNGKALARWLDREQPDCIFVAPGVAKFLYNFALDISRSREIPVVCYFCDEYYFVKKPAAGLETLRVRLLRGKIRQLLERASHLVTISEEMRQAYACAFSLPVTTLMTGAAYPAAERVRPVRESGNLCYFGNIRCNRYLPLAEVGRELDRINEETGSSHRLNIYTAEQEPQILKSFDGIRSVRLCGFLSGDELEQAMDAADLLLHVEAFDEASMDFTRHSVSTKIADALARGIALVAYGPGSLSSMRHLQRNGCALLASSREQLGQVLRSAFEDPALCCRTAEKGLAAAAAFHDKQKNTAVLRRILEDASRKA